MDAPNRISRSNEASAHFSPYLLAVALTPILLQSSTPLSCGDTTLSELELIVQGEDRIAGFDSQQRSYDVSLPLAAGEATVHAVSTDRAAQVWVEVVSGDERVRYVYGGLGGGDLVVSLPPGSSVLEVWVKAPEGGSDFYKAGTSDPGSLAYDSCPAPATDGGGVVLSIDLDAAGNAWVLGEFHTALTYIENTDPCPMAVRTPIPINGTPFRYNDRPTHLSVLGESVEVADDGVVWFTQGGEHLGSAGTTNHSRVGRYDPGNATFQMYNVPGNRNEVVGLWLDEMRGWVWITEAGFESDGVAQTSPHQGAIMAFDPNTAPWDNAWGWGGSLDEFLCDAGEEPSGDRCFKRYDLPAATWTALRRGAFWPAHLIGDANGDIWFTSFWGSSIGRLEPDTETVTLYPLNDHRSGGNPIVGVGPWEIAISPDGRYLVWSEYFDATISRMSLSRADDAVCQVLVGGANPCVEEHEVALNLAHQNIHSIAYDANHALWFATGTAPDTAAGSVTSTLGFVSAGWEDVVLLDPRDFTPNFNPHSDISYTGISINQSTGEIWANEGAGSTRFALARFRPVP
jgi:streptogramin lyase